MKGRKLYNGQPFTGRAVLVYSGLTERQSLDYRKKLDELADRLGIRAIDISSSSSLSQSAFFEAYGIADIVTYPTVFEGWGNQLLEALVYRKPLALFRYSVLRAIYRTAGSLS